MRCGCLVSPTKAGPTSGARSRTQSPAKADRATLPAAYNAALFAGTSELSRSGADLPGYSGVKRPGQSWTRSPKPPFSSGWPTCAAATCESARRDRRRARVRTRQPGNAIQVLHQRGAGDRSRAAGMTALNRAAASAIEFFGRTEPAASRSVSAARAHAAGAIVTKHRRGALCAGIESLKRNKPGLVKRPCGSRISTNLGAVSGDGLAPARRQGHRRRSSTPSVRGRDRCSPQPRDHRPRARGHCPRSRRCCLRRWPSSTTRRWPIAS